MATAPIKRTTATRPGYAGTSRPANKKPKATGQASEQEKVMLREIDAALERLGRDIAAENAAMDDLLVRMSKPNVA